MTHPPPPASADTPQVAWHALPPVDVLHALQTPEATGLSPEQVQQRLAQHGPNRLPKTARRPVWLRFLLQFHNPLIYVLLAAGLTTLALGSYVDAGVIMGVVL
ncbi:MAG: cation-transporting P-type ATPase, partial [Macromonas sp.]